MSEDDFRELMRTLNAISEQLSELRMLTKAVTKVGERLGDINEQVGGIRME